MRRSFFVACVLLAASLPPAGAQSAHPLRAHTTPGSRSFGSAVAGTGDLTGDGRPDYAVGAPDLGKFGLDGAVYVYNGATGILARTLHSPVAGREARFGAAVAAVADLTGDGVADLLVGEPDQDGVAQESGRAYVFDGATGALLRTFVPPASAASGDFGAAVADAGDVSGDGVADLLVGATDAAGFAGQAFLYNGATGALLQTFNTPTPRNGGSFGTNVTGLADANGDGVRDVLVGAPREGNTPFAGFGHLHLFSGATGAVIRTITSPQPSETGRFGQAVAVGTDVTGDGTPEVYIGEPNGGPGQPGTVYLYDLATSSFPQTLHPPPSGPGAIVGTFGAAVTRLGDVTLDGVPDVLVGDPAFNSSSSQPFREGRVHLYDGATAQELATVRSSQPQPGGGFGTALAVVGDVDADGDPDFLVGAPGETSGRAYVFGSIPGGVVVPPGLLSEYVEGSGFNRAIEVYNDSASPLDLSTYSLRLFLNGAATPGATILLAGTLAPGAVLVVADERADPAVLAAADLTTSTLLFSGNDAVGLYAADEVLDLIGQIGVDPGVAWGSGDTSTADHTLRREGGACTPDADSTNAFNPSVNYAGYPLDTFDGLGTTTLTCAMPSSVPNAPATAFTLSAPFPNPAAGRATLFLTLTEAQAVRVEAFDALGRRVAVLHGGPLGTGTHSLTLDGSLLAPGIYVVRAAGAGGRRLSRRLVVH